MDRQSRNSFSGSLGYDNFGNKSKGYVNEEQAQYAQPSGSTLSDLFSLVSSGNHFRAHSIDWGLVYKKTFPREDKELDILLEGSSGNNNSAYNQAQSLPSGDSIFSGSNSANTGRDHQSNLHIDFTQPLGENTRLETGLRMQIRQISSYSNVFTLDPTAGQYAYDTSQSNSLTYTRHVYAGYASLLFPVYKLLNVKAGLRYERTETDAGFSKAVGTSIPGYNTFAPSGHPLS